MHRYLPIVAWARSYRQGDLSADLVAALIVTIMLIPQSLAYALLAGLPPEVGLYASIAPLVLYGIFGTSRVLSVGPVAVVSLMTAAAVGELASVGTPEYYAAAIALALLSGAMLTAMGIARLGFLANFLSHPVIAGFITASGIIIATSQVKHILGVSASGHDLLTLVMALGDGMSEANLTTLGVGAATLTFLVWARRSLKPLLMKMGFGEALATIIARSGPAIAVIVAACATYALDLPALGVAIVGDVPRGLPPLSVPSFDLALWSSLATSALLISVIGFVESVSVAQTLAAKRRQRIEPDQELIGLGVANIGAAFTGGYPVTGGFSRSVVNFDAGARTPAAGLFTAVGIGIATLFLTPFLYYLPKAVLAATIIVAVLTLVDLKAIVATWRYSGADFAAQAGTIALTLTQGVEVGIVTGVSLSLILHLYRTSRPHYAVVGQVPGTEHFRNTSRHQVVTVPGIYSLRIDESLYFPNARALEDRVYRAVADDTTIKHVVLMCSAVNDIDASALESLEAINHRLGDAGVTLHLSEVKGPIEDKLSRTRFFDGLTGRVFLTQFEAIRTLAPESAMSTRCADMRETTNPAPEARLT